MDKSLLGAAFFFEVFMNLSDPILPVNVYIDRMEEFFTRLREICGACKCAADNSCSCGKMTIQNAIAGARFYALEAIRSRPAHG